MEFIRASLSRVVQGCFIFLGASVIHGATTPSYIYENTTAPDKATIDDTPISTSQKYYSIEAQEDREPSFIPAVTEWMMQQDPFIRDARLDLNVRSYFLNADTSTPGSERDAWALGGGLVFKSGHWKDFFAIGAAGYTTQPLYAPDGSASTRLLGPNNSGFTVLGMAYAELKVKEVKGRFYRQIIDTPFLNQDDNRMIPNTFEAYMIGSNTLRPIEFLVGQVTKVKTKDSDEFVGISEGLGLSQSTNGTTLAGIQAHLFEDSQFGFFNYYAWDIANIFYTEFDHDFGLEGPWSWTLGFQFSDQHSVGDELLGSGSAQQGGISTSVGYDGFVFSLSGSKIFTDVGVIAPYGSYPGFTSMIIDDFNAAGQSSIVIGLSYDFKNVGLDGLSAYTNLGYAWAQNADTNNVPPRTGEFDITVDYRIKEGPLKNLWFRVRSAWVSQENTATTTFNAINDYRIIINYDIPLL